MINLQLVDFCQSTILSGEVSIINITNESKRNTNYFTKTRYFRPLIRISKYTIEQKKFLILFNFEHSQFAQQEFEKLAALLLIFPIVFATSKFDV